MFVIVCSYNENEVGIIQIYLYFDNIDMNVFYNKKDIF